MAESKVKSITMTNTKGLSFFAALTLLLILLKVLGYEVPLWMIICAFFGPILVALFVVLAVIGFGILCFLGSIFFDYLETRARKKRWKVENDKK